MTVDELINLDLAYAPPFSPVWDPLATAARVASRRRPAPRPRRPDVKLVTAIVKPFTPRRGEGGAQGGGRRSA